MGYKPILNLSNLSYEDIESGTMVLLSDKIGSLTFYAIIIKDIDEDNTIIFDLDDGCYYTDIDNYKIISTIKNYGIYEI